MQVIACARALALERAGSSRAARMAIMAITTSNSIKVKARCPRFVAGSCTGGLNAVLMQGVVFQIVCQFQGIASLPVSLGRLCPTGGLEVNHTFVWPGRSGCLCGRSLNLLCDKPLDPAAGALDPRGGATYSLLA